MPFLEYSKTSPVRKVAQLQRFFDVRTDSFSLLLNPDWSLIQILGAPAVCKELPVYKLKYHITKVTKIMNFSFPRRFVLESAPYKITNTFKQHGCNDTPPRAPRPDYAD